MERTTGSHNFKNLVENSISKEVVEVLFGMKQSALILKIGDGPDSTECLYRFEEGIRLKLDNRVPKKEELKRDIAFHRVDNALSWNLTAPVIPWSLEKGQSGSIRPFWREVVVKDSYFFNKQNMRNSDYWLKVAVLDYICGVVDRNANDILFINEIPVLIDSGLSFVDEVDFITQTSIIRSALSGESIPERILKDLRLLKRIGSYSNINNLLGRNQINWVKRRIDNILAKGVII